MKRQERICYAFALVLIFFAVQTTCDDSVLIHSGFGFSLQNAALLIASGGHGVIWWHEFLDSAT